jgi:predicted Fe-Mo cluster-binding NifX family protein
MQIVVSAQDKDLNSEVDMRFGRAKYFLLIDTDTLAFEVIENKQSLDLPQGAGIQAAQNVIPRRPAAVVTGNCGPKAFKMLQAAGIPVLLGAKGSVSDAVKSYVAGDLQTADQPNVQGHWM